MRVLDQFEDVIDVLGGPAAVGRLCGQATSAVCCWRKRNERFPCRYYWEIRAALQLRGCYPSSGLFNFFKGRWSLDDFTYDTREAA